MQSKWRRGCAARFSMLQNLQQQTPSRVFCTARSDRFSTVSTWLSTSCISQRFPPQFIVAGRPLFAAFLRPACPTIELSEVLAAEKRTLCQRREVRRCWARAGSYTCRRRGSGPTPCSRASILIPAAFRNWPGASGSTAFAAADRPQGGRRV